jgi:hypothetical protein
VLAIIAIVVAAIVAVVVVLVILTGGTGLLIWKRTAMKLDNHAANFEGELVETQSVPMGVEVDAPSSALQENPINMKKMASFHGGV